MPNTPPSPAESPADHRWRLALLLLSLLGAVLPWIFNLRWFAAGGSVAPQVFWPATAANDLTTAITIDVYLAAAAFAAWVLHERRVRRPWLWVLGCFGVGLACVLPLYLLRREPLKGALPPAPSVR